MEKQKVFVKLNQVWKKGEIVSQEDSILQIKTTDNLEFKVDESSPYFERTVSPAQKFAMGDAKEKLEGAYISFNKLPRNVKESIVKGEEYIYASTYLNEGEVKESVKAVQLMYDRDLGSKLDVQIKRNKPVTLEEAKAYNHQFTQQEFNVMVKEGKQVLFQGSTTDGEVFNKLAYYEPKLNDIRTKTALSENTYFYGQKLTKNQATSMNKGEPVQITIDTSKGKKTYMVSYSPKAERFITKNMEMDKVKDLKVNSAKNVTAEKKKKQQSNSLAH